MSVEDAERAFYTALRTGDGAALADVLTSDFIFVDFVGGAELSRADLVSAVFGGQLRFDAIEVISSRVRRYGPAAIVTGRTDMRGRASGTTWTARSRYTHVYIEQNGRWRLASAQETPDPQISADRGLYSGIADAN